ncbi:tRNA (cytosine(72)-C(5))-methyltransferase NSUN6 isoform X2 [Ostrinia nubilalis]|uniref:tRNA (cytosine(72)-C(5))-methyltransferase NSUN6 isoform X2 n=1 Tax=Ostrinia nubilalis TaxID=29057 RepID=UPI0030822EEE
MEDIKEWLSLPPQYTTFRVNKLKKFDCNTLETYLSTKAPELNTTSLPNYYFLKPDCLVVEQWPVDVKVDKGRKEVIVDALCAAAVLRGAHVFAPGVVGMPTNCQLDEMVDIYGDIDGQCKRGLKVTFQGRKLFVGTGVLKMLRRDLFDNGVQPSLLQAFIIAMDKTRQKVEKLKENCIKQGVTCVTAYAFDSTKCCSNDSKNIDSGPPFPPNSFDKVLLDAPCSGLGQRPQLNNKMTPKMLESYKVVQRKLMKAAVDVLKEGGTLVYSTCTVTIDENEGLVQWTLENFPCLRLVPAEPLLGGPGLSGSGLNDDQRVMVQRFGPEVDNLRLAEPIYRDSIGFFIAKFTKSH